MAELSEVARVDVDRLRLEVRLRYREVAARPE